MATRSLCTITREQLTIIITINREIPRAVAKTQHSPKEVVSKVFLKKPDVVHIYIGILTTKRNTTGSFTEMWMELETVIQSEVRKKKICILMHICGIPKNGIADVIRKAGLPTGINGKETAC